MGQEDIIEIFGTTKWITDKVILFNDGGVESWVPRSKIEDDAYPEVDEDGSIFIPSWLAADKGFI